MPIDIPIYTVVNTFFIYKNTDFTSQLDDSKPISETEFFPKAVLH